MREIELEINKQDFKDKLGIKDGKDGKTPTKKELISIIKPLIPEPKKEVIIEKTEVIREQPINIENKVTGVEIVDKINELPIDKEYQIDAKHIKNLKDSVNVIQRIGGGGGFNGVKTDTTLTGDGTEESPLHAVGDGIGDMLKSTYDPANGAKQVAFADDLEDLAKLAIETTQNNLYTNLIPNNLLIPNQWYLITDFLADDLIAGTTESKTGLNATFINAQGIQIQLYYDDGVTPIVEGDTEAIYLRASTTNSFYPVGYSKTFSKEQITFLQHPNPITGSINPNGYGEEDPYRNLSSYVNGDSEIVNDNTQITLESIIDATTCVLGGTDLNTFKNVFFGNGNTSFEFYNATQDTYFYGDEGNYGYNWTLDWETGEFVFLDGSFDLTDFQVENSYCYGYFTAPRFTPFTGSTDGSPLYQENTEFYVDEIISKSEIKFAGSNVDKFATRIANTFGMDVNNDNIASYINYNDDNEGVDWSYNPTTNVFTDLTGNADFRNLIYQSCSYSGYFEYIVKEYRGLIVERYRPSNELRVGVDYRSKLNRRYKVLCDTWSAGTYSPGTYVRNVEYIWLCLTQTTEQPTYDTTNWLRVMPDTYLMAQDQMQINNYAFIPDLDDYIDTPTFSTHSFLDSQKDNICTNDLKTNANSPFNLVLYEDILISYSNLKVRADKSTFYGNSGSSTISATRTIFGQVSSTQIGWCDSSIINYASASSYDLLYISYLGNHSQVISKYLYGVISRTMQDTLIFKLNNVVFKDNCLKNTFYQINNTVFNSYIQTSTIKAMYDSTFKSYVDGSIIDYLNSVTFNSYVISSNIAKVFNSTFNAWVGVTIKSQIQQSTCLASWSNFVFHGNGYGINIPVSINDSDLKQFTSISGTDGSTMSISSCYMDGIYSITLTDATVNISNCSGSKLYSTTFKGKTQIQSVIFGGLFYGSFGEDKKTVGSISSGVITITNHGYTINQRVKFLSTGTYPSGIDASNDYYVASTSFTANTFKLSQAQDNNNMQSPGSSWTGTLSIQPSQSLENFNCQGQVQGASWIGTRTMRSVFAPSSLDGKTVKCFNDQLTLGIGTTGDVIDLRNINSFTNNTGINTLNPQTDLDVFKSTGGIIRSTYNDGSKIATAQLQATTVSAGYPRAIFSIDNGGATTVNAGMFVQPSENNKDAFLGVQDAPSSHTTRRQIFMLVNSSSNKAIFSSLLNDMNGVNAPSMVFSPGDYSASGGGNLVLLPDTAKTSYFNGNVGIGTTSPNSKLQVAGSLSLPYVAKTANYTLDSTDYTVDCTTNTFTITLPTAVGIQGRIYNIKNTGTGVITVDANGTQTIDGNLTITLSQYDSVTLQSTNAGWVIL